MITSLHFFHPRRLAALGLALTGWAPSVPAAVSTPPAPVALENTFRFGDGGLRINIYGGLRGGERPVFFNEWLPALFERTLLLEDFAPDKGALQWVFTGPRGGVTVRVDDDEVMVTQRYYDSYGLYINDPLTVRNSPRFPEEEWSRANAPRPAKLTSLTVSLDRRFALKVRAGEQTLVEMPCLLDLQQHQLQWDGNTGSASGRMVSTPALPVRVTLNPFDRHQAIIGFGGITSPLSYRRLSEPGRRAWWRLLANYNLLIQREYPVGTQLKPDFSNFDDTAAAVPHYYGSNPNDSETSDFAYNRAIMALGGETWFEFWRLPGWMLPNSRGGRGPTTNDPDPELYSDAIVAYCKASAAKAGAPPTIVGVQNELCPTPQALALMLPALRKKLDAAGFGAVKIQMANAGRLTQGLQFAAAHQQAGIWPVIDFAASNIYDVQDNFRDADRNVPLFTRFKEATQGKDFLSVEICVNSNAWQTDSYRLALAMGQVFHQDLTIANARALIYCWLLMHVPEPSFGWTRMLFRIDASHDLMPVSTSGMLRVFGAYSRHIQRGMVRIGADSTDPDVFVVAFLADDGRETVVLLNRAMQPRRVTVAGLSYPMTIAELADPYHENTALPTPPTPRGTQTMVEVPPGALVTLSSVPLLTVPADFKVP